MRNIRRPLPIIGLCKGQRDAVGGKIHDQHEQQPNIDTIRSPVGDLFWRRNRSSGSNGALLLDPVWRPEGCGGYLRRGLRKSDEDSRLVLLL